MPLRHKSAKPSHYDCAAEHYDLLNEENSKEINALIVSILKRYGAGRVIDFTCGTGSQVFALAAEGFEVVGVDINRAMLEVARKKGGEIELIEGDMRSTCVGEFDAALTVFNAVGHLTRADFEMAMRNMASNLKGGGLYVFDIFNLDFLLFEDQITQLTIDWYKGDRVREIQYSTIDEEGVLASFTTSIVGGDRVESSQTLQVYRAADLREILKRNGFEVVEQYSADGSPLDPVKSERILTVARVT